MVAFSEYHVERSPSISGRRRRERNLYPALYFGIGLLLWVTNDSALGSVYTADTVTALVGRFPRARFVWLMGADNLIQVSDWKNWETIFRTVAVAVFDRPSYSLRALAATAARRFARQRLPESAARTLAERAPPAWVFVHQRLNPQSSTGIRAAGHGRARAKRDPG